MGRTPPHAPEVPQFDLQRILEALVDPVRRSIGHAARGAGEDIKCGDFDMQVSKSTAHPPLQGAARAGGA
ncbi:hypothetical protein [Nonomuraea dietziae]|uniref:hypothetical protein n=1 Tax=Nonomuraea dietziae TaxID=65515 RepID=UPI0031E39B21